MYVSASTVMTTTTTWDPSGSMCVEYTWKLALQPLVTRYTLFQSEFVGIPGVTDKALRFAIGSDDTYGSYNYICCYTNTTALSQFGFKPSTVTYAKHEKDILRKSCRLMEQVDKDPTCMLFQKRGPFTISDRLIFRVYLTSLVEHYALYRFDDQPGQDLWTAAVNAQLTDFVFQIGSVNISAHKFVLAARSPVFRAMLDADMIESRTGRVQIVDCSPETFKQFLYFIYTGQLMKPASKELGMVADKYAVESLMSLCQATVAYEVAGTKDLLTFAKSKQTELRFDRKLKSTT